MVDLLNGTSGVRGRRYRAPVVAALLAAALSLLYGVGAANAARFGPPWQARVAVDRAVVHSQPDPGSSVVGPLPQGAIAVVLGETAGADGDLWLQIPVGYLLAGEVEELYASWVAEVTLPAVSVYAKPYVASGVRRTARQGDLLRVTGVSAGLEGDTALWWATTEGYVALDALRGATGEWAGAWTLPEAGEAPGGWWGSIRSEANVRVSPTRRSPIVGVFAGGERVKVLAEEQGEPVNGNALWYRIDGGRFAGARVHSSLVQRVAEPKPNTAPPPPDAGPGPWIVVDRSASTLTYVVDGQARFTTYVSIGKAGAATPTGSYSTFGKFRGDRMSSRTVPNASHPYDLPNVPFTQYYIEGGYAIHGTYWHDRFGSPESQGCINLTWADSAYLFALTQPSVPDGANERWAPGAGGLATPVVIVD